MTARRQWAIVAGIVATIGVSLAMATHLLRDSVAPVEAGTKAPDFVAVPVPVDAPRNAAPLPAKTIASYQGQVVVLNIWATWCNPCRAEMPSMQRLYEELGPKGLKVVAVSIDNPGMEQPIRDFTKELGLHFEILYDATGNIRNDYQTVGVPETFVIGKDGVIRKRVVAAADWNAESQKALLRELLAER